MATQLSLDVLFMIAEEIAVPSKAKAALNFSLVSRRVHDVTYPLILKTNALANPIAADSKCTAVCSSRRRLWRERQCKKRQPNEIVDHSLEFFIISDNPVLVAKYLYYTRTDINAVIHTEFMGKCGSLASVAVYAGATSVVELFLKVGAKFRNTISESQQHPLASAVLQNHVPITKLLLDHGRLQEYLAYRGYSQDEVILEWIVSGDTSLEMAKVLLPYCSNPNQTLDEHCRTALHTLVSLWDGNSREVRDRIIGKIELLIQAGADIDALTATKGQGQVYYQSALNIASTTHSPYIGCLLGLGASALGAAAFDIEGCKLHSFPPGRCHSDSLSFLGSYSDSYGDSDDSYGYPYGDSDGDGDAIADAIYNGTGNSDAVIPIVHTPLYDILRYLSLHTKIEEELLESIKLLVESRGFLYGDQNVRENLFFEVLQGRVDCSRLWAILMDGGVFDVHHRDQFGRTLLSQLASENFSGGIELIGLKRFPTSSFWKPNLVRALIMAGSDPNTVDQSEMTPLHWAIFHGNFDLAKLLIELGADPVKEINGATPVHYAFGKPFSRRGPLVEKVMEVLRERLALLVAPTEHGVPYSVPAFGRYEEGEWHPLLSNCLDGYMRQSKAGGNEARLFSIMALFFPFAEAVGRDEYGHTPREIAEKAGILNEGDSVLLRIDDKVRHELPEGVPYSEYLACIQDEHLERVDPSSNKASFPPSLYDSQRTYNLDWAFRPAFATLLKTTLQSGECHYGPASMACFRSLTTQTS